MTLNLSGALQQILSSATNYPTPTQSNDLKLVFVYSFKDIINTWHIKCVIENTSPNQQNFLSMTTTIQLTAANNRHRESLCYARIRKHYSKSKTDSTFRHSD
jgi:dolichyl-phosphate-mannose--protein O-mannosyl transferase